MGNFGSFIRGRMTKVGITRLSSVKYACFPWTRPQPPRSQRAFAVGSSDSCYFHRSQSNFTPDRYVCSLWCWKIWFIYLQFYKFND